MKLSHALLLLLGAAALTVLVVSQVVLHGDRPWFYEDVEEVEYVLHVSENPGMDVGTDVLRLGAVPPGSSSRRGVTVAHDSAERVFAEVAGEGSGFVSVRPRSAALVNGSAAFVVSARPANETALGEYRGVVRFYFD